MQFKHPELLYFLFLLVIPVLVHLFQLRKFKKEYFTNVKLLKELSIQTRKSATLKKYLLLATRLLLLASLIIAFAQPFFSAKDASGKNNELYIILDNSFSMQAKGEKGELMKRAVQDLLENMPQEVSFSLLTNDGEYWNNTLKNVEKDLQKIKYSAIPFSLSNALVKVKSHNKNNGRDIVVITDGIGLNAQNLTKLPENTKTYFHLPEAEKLENISIDSVYISQNLDNFYELSVGISSNFEAEKTIPIAVYNENNLIAKTIISLNKSKQIVHFTLPKMLYHAKVVLHDNSLDFDNTFYFTIPKLEPSKVLSIGEPVKSNFLERIYKGEEFQYRNTALKELDYSLIEKQDAIILNELENIPQALQTNLRNFYAKGGNLIIIPSEKTDSKTMNGLLHNFGLQLSALENREKKVTKIHFSNPLFSDVFEKRTSNFQYPYTKQSFGIQGTTSQAFSFEDQTAFLTTSYKNNSGLFVFAAPLNTENSNFQNSPLIVPTFYKMALPIDKNGVQYHTIGDSKAIYVDVKVNKEEVISLQSNSENFIPFQQIMDEKIKISCGENPKESGNYWIVQHKTNIQKLSFNYDRKESQLTIPSRESLSQLNTIDSLSNFFETIQMNRTDQQAWKWFLIFTLLFLVLEILIQKFIK